MRAKTAAARAICYVTARAIDESERSETPEARQTAAAMAGLLTPVAKAVSTDLGVEVASDGIQVHGGMGYVEETGAAQHLRDARITPIYEGTNGIQAMDLVARKLPMAGGDVVRGHIANLREIVRNLQASNEPAFGSTADCLDEAVTALEQSSAWLLEMLGSERDKALAGATPYARLFGLASGGAYLAKGALAAARDGSPGNGEHIAVARFFAEHCTVEASGLARAIMGGADAIVDAFPEALSA